jgi:hypothetical protein
MMVAHFLGFKDLEFEVNYNVIRLRESICFRQTDALRTSQTQSGFHTVNVENFALTCGSLICCGHE